jgi:hypothetical protein
MIYSKWVGQLSVGMLLGLFLVTMETRCKSQFIITAPPGGSSGMSAAVGIIVATIGKCRSAV